MANAALKRNLLDDCSDVDEEVGCFKVNESFAKRLEYSKRREDLQRLNELKKRGLVSDDSDSDEDEDEDEDGFLPERTDSKIFETLAKIKKKDPVIYKSDVNFFDEDEDEDVDDETFDAKKKKKAVYLKDMNAQHVLEGSDDDDEDENHLKHRPKTYVQEQNDLKNEFIRSVAEAAAEDDEDGFFKVRKKSNEEIAKDEAEAEEAAKKMGGISSKLDEYFGRDDNLDENDKFLKSFLLNKGWIDTDQDRIPTQEEVLGELEDEEELWEQDDYESGFNFRFEEGVGSQVLGHSRSIDDSVRKIASKRKEERKKKKERQSEAEMARREEIKRLKNVKKKEIFEKLSKIKSVAGGGGEMEGMINEEDLEEDFDPAEYDKKMNEMFGEEYYAADDAEFVEDEDGNVDLEEEGDDDDDGRGRGEREKQQKLGFAAIREKQKRNVKKQLEEEEEEEGCSEKKKVCLKEKMMIDKQLDEYYKLDYEDMIGDLPTRFKYTNVKADKYGLDTVDILCADNKELNQHVSLKLLAPYRTEEVQPSKHKKYGRRYLTKKERKERSLNQMPNFNNHQPKDKIAAKISAEGEGEGEGAGAGQVEGECEGDVGVGGDESKKKRKRRKKGLPLTRLISYGKVDLPKNSHKRRKFLAQAMA